MPAPPVDAVARALIALYEEAEEKITAALISALARKATGTARFHELQRQAIRNELERLRIQAAPLEGALAASSYSAGAVAVDRTLDLSKAFSGVHGPAMEVLAANLALELGEARQTIGRRADDALRNIGLRTTAQAITGGLTQRQHEAEIRRDLLHGGITSFVDAGGRRWRLSTYAAMAARTITREAVTQGTVNRLRDHGRSRVTISKHLGACVICIPHEGKTYPIDGSKPLPPFHANCAHIAAPARADFEQFEKELGIALEKPTEVRQLAAPSQRQITRPPAIPQPSVPTAEVRDNFEVRSTVRAPAREALDAIGGVHNAAAGQRIPIKLDQQMDALGAFRRSSQGSRAYDIKLNLRDARDEWGPGGPAFVLIHELGHYLDHQAFRSEHDASGTPGMASEGSEILKEVLAAAEASPPIIELRRIAAANYGGWLSSHVAYLLRPREIFARVYAQWITERSADPAIMRAMQRSITQAGRLPVQWLEEDFEAIGEAMDEVFRSRGWLK